MKLLADLANMDEVIKDENKALILLSFLPDDDLLDLHSHLNQY